MISTPKPAPRPYQRVLLKLSGEALMGKRDYGLDNDTVVAIAADIVSVVAMGVQVCVVGGGLRHGALAGRFDRHAGNGDERARDAKRAGTARGAHPGAVGDRDVEP